MLKVKDWLSICCQQFKCSLEEYFFTIIVGNWIEHEEGRGREKKNHSIAIFSINQILRWSRVGENTKADDKRNKRGGRIVEEFFVIPIDGYNLAMI